MATPNQTSDDKRNAPPSNKPDPSKPRDSRSPTTDDRKPRGGDGQIDTSDKPDGVR